jgi:hypothetical protein
MAENADTPADAVDTSIQETDAAPDTDIEDVPVDQWDGEETEESQDTEESEEDSEKEGQPNQENTDEAEENKQPDAPEDAEKKEQARLAYQQRQEKRQAKALQQSVREFEQQADPNDVNQQVQAMQLREYNREVMSNQESLVREMREGENLPLFKENPELYQEYLDEFDRTYTITDDRFPDDQGNPLVVGAFDPRTGEKVSLLNYLQTHTARLERVSQRSATQGKQAAQHQRAIAETPPAANPQAGRGSSLEDLEERLGDIKLT